jgi:hypothetical protein
MRTRLRILAAVAACGGRAASTAVGTDAGAVGGDASVVARPTPAVLATITHPTGLAIAGNALFASGQVWNDDPHPGVIVSIPLGGGAMTNLFSEEYFPSELETHDGELFWIGARWAARVTARCCGCRSDGPSWTVDSTPFTVSNGAKH